MLASSKVIFDEDIDKQGQHVNMSIFAPTWEIISPLTNSQVQRKVLFNASFDFNFFATFLTTFNAGSLHFKIDGETGRLRKLSFDGRGLNKSSALALIMIQSNEFDNTKSVNAYRQFAKEDFAQTIRNANLWKFLAELNMDFNQFNLDELIEEFFGLEDKIRTKYLKDEIDFLPLYQTLRSQLEYFKQQPTDNDELRKIFHAALISKTLTIREKGLIFVKIAGVTENLEIHIKGFNQYCDASTNLLGSNRDNELCSKENIQEYKKYADHIQRMGNFKGIFRPAESLALNTQKFLDESFNRSVHHTEDGNSADQFNTQVIYHQIRTPFKIIQLLLSFKIVQNVSDNMEEKLHQLSKEIQYKPKLFKEMLEDFDGILSNTARQ